MNEITDEEVRRLDLAAGRAELLEGIMSTPVVDHDEVRIGSRRRMGPWLAVAVTAAAVVLAAVIVPQWLGSAFQGPPSRSNTGRSLVSREPRRPTRR